MASYALVIVSILLTTVFGFITHPDGDIGSSLPSLAEPSLRIGSFNIQIFGQTKYHRKDVVNVLLKILSRYDVVQILEIRDSKGTVFDHLRQDLNNYMHSIGSSVQYSSVVSGRLGRTNIKEQYGFLYRTSRVNATGTYQFQDTKDFFEREPFGVRFSSPSTIVKDFGLVAVHIQPSQAKEEIDNLTNVYDTFHRHWNLQDIIIAGDYNSDCSFLAPTSWSTISFRTDTRFTWLVDDKVDTTVADSFCVYDRFVVGGNAIPQSVVAGSVQAYRFDEIMGLNKSMGEDVSDHFPIEMELKGAPHTAVQGNILSSVSFTVTDKRLVANDNYIRATYRNPSCADPNFKVKVLRENTHMDHVTISFSIGSVGGVMKALQSFSTTCPNLLSPELLSTAQAYLKSNFIEGDVPNVYGLTVKQDHLYPVEISCSLVTPRICKVTVTRQVSG